MNQGAFRFGRLAALLAAWPALLAAEGYILETKLEVAAGPIASKYSLTLVRSWRDDRHAAHSVQSAAPLAPETVKAILREPGVLELESDSLVEEEHSISSSASSRPLDALAIPADSAVGVDYYGSRVRRSYVNQGPALAIGLPDALLRFGAGSATVAIIDTGVDPRHPALRNVLLPGYDFTRNLPGTADELADLDQSTVAILDQSTVAILDQKNTPLRLSQSTVAILDQSTVAILDANKLPASFGHGTMVAGLVHLVAPQARILPLKAFRADGSASLSNIVQAIYYAVDHGATVISMSFSMSTPSPELQQALTYAASKRVVCVASAGNEGSERKTYPAAFSKVIGVGSVNARDLRSPFSNHGDSAKTSAPGEAIVTTYPGNNYAGVWGTSFATALVSGAAALMQHVRPGASYSEVKSALEKGQKIAQDMGDARLSLVPSISHCMKR